MKLHPPRPSAAMVVAVLALCIAVGGGTALAASAMLPRNSVGSEQLQAASVTHNKIADGVVGPDKLSDTAKKELTGARGPKGATGAKGATGPKGATGATGKQGPAGKDAAGITSVTALDGTSTWDSHNNSAPADGTSSIDANGAQLGGSAGNGGLTSSDDYAGISTDVLNNLTPADLSSISYTENYTMPNDSNLAAPYFKLKLQPVGGSCGDTDVVYNPSVQSTNLDYSGQTETFDVTAPYSTVGVNNDANPVDGTYPSAIHSAANGAGADVSNDKICLAEIILGGGSASEGAKATVYDVSFAGKGLEPVTYVFGS